MDRDLIRVVVGIIALVGAGVGAYAGVTVVSLLKQRFETKSREPGLPPEELEAIHSRLAAAEALEARVTELEERLDFAERLLARNSEPERLPAAQPITPQH